eukprot:SAG11_NODE_1393_length_5047_cov_14.071140_6_plen_59_part_00
MINTSIRYISGNQGMLKFNFIFNFLAWKYSMIVYLSIIKLQHISLCNRTVKINKFKFG